MDVLIIGCDIDHIPFFLSYGITQLIVIFFVLLVLKIFGCLVSN